MIILVAGLYFCQNELELKSF